MAWSGLVMRSGLAAVPDELEAADHLANGEEADELGGDDTCGGELGAGDVPDVVDNGLGGLEEAAGAEGGPDVLVEGLEGGDGTRRACQLRAFFLLFRKRARKARLYCTHGRLIFWPWKTSLASSRVTLE